MNHSMIDSVFTGLIKQLVYFDENSILLLDKYAPQFDRERREVEHLMNIYKENLELIIRDFNAVILNSIVLIGSQVTVMNDVDGLYESYTIVLPEHSDMEQYFISFLSPIGRMLLLSKVGERITVPSPSGSYDLTVTKIEFLVF
jgi:transcription elongation factor GreA